MRIVVGAVVSLPPFSPGMAWNWMQHVAGLRELGHDVWLVEELDPAWWVDAAGAACPPEQSVNRRTFRALCERFGLTDRAVQVDRGDGSVFGMDRNALVRIARQADLLVNMSGHVRDEDVLGGVQRRAYVDQDPVYTQLWLDQYGRDAHVDAHDVFLTVGLDIGTSRSPIPTAGIDWRRTLPPVVLDWWEARDVARGSAWTTVASWTGYSDVVHDGRTYSAKHVEFERFADLPRRSGARFEVALKAWREHDTGIERLRNGGWTVRRGCAMGTMPAYQDYISASYGEIGIAKHAYVHGRSGWFSDRSAHYLAAGRPVLAQATGYEAHLPTGAGLLAFSTLDEAIDAVAEVTADHRRHCLAARDLAREHLDHRRVLPTLLERCMEHGRREAVR